MQLVYGVDAEVAMWVASQIPHVGREGFGPCSAIGIETGGRLVGGMVYHDWQRDFATVQLSMAAVHPMWARRRIVKGLLAYPFYQLDCHKVWTATPIDGEAAIRTNLHVGFTKEAVLAHHFGPKRHAVICRLLKPKFQRLYGED
jgi:RimJ/RimL family protein N-acetyltransferase